MHQSLGAVWENPKPPPLLYLSDGGHIENLGLVELLRRCNETILVVDFDVSQNFVVQGNPNTPAGINGILFTPSLRAIVRDIAASITGTVSSTSSGSLAGITVMAEQTDAAVPEALQTTMATAVVDSTSGTYTIRFLAPGTYTVSLDVAGNTPVTGVVLTEGSTATQDFQIP